MLPSFGAAKHFFKMTLDHKRAVYNACLILDVPVWQALTHDLSKFRPSEFIPYANFLDPAWPVHTFGNTELTARPNRIRDAFKAAVRLHKSRNMHHNEYWQINTLYSDFDSDLGKVPMPRRYAREMVADWLGASEVYSGHLPTSMDEWTWWDQHKSKMFDHFHPMTREYVAEAIYDWLEYWNGLSTADEQKREMVGCVEWAFGRPTRQAATHD